MKFVNVLTAAVLPLLRHVVPTRAEKFVPAASDVPHPASVPPAPQHCAPAPRAGINNSDPSPQGHSEAKDPQLIILRAEIERTQRVASFWRDEAIRLRAIALELMHLLGIPYVPATVAPKTQSKDRLPGSAAPQDRVEAKVDRLRRIAGEWRAEIDRFQILAAKRRALVEQLRRLAEQRNLQAGSRSSTVASTAPGDGADNPRHSGPLDSACAAQADRERFASAPTVGQVVPGSSNGPQGSTDDASAADGKERRADVGEDTKHNEASPMVSIQIEFHVPQSRPRRATPRPPRRFKKRLTTHRPLRTTAGGHPVDPFTLLDAEAALLGVQEATSSADLREAAGPITAESDAPFTTGTPATLPSDEGAVSLFRVQTEHVGGNIGALELFAQQVSPSVLVWQSDASNSVAPDTQDGLPRPNLLDHLGYGPLVELPLPGDDRVLLFDRLPNTVLFNDGGDVSVVLRAPEETAQTDDDVLVVVSLPGNKELRLDCLPAIILLRDEDVTVILRAPDLQPDDQGADQIVVPPSPEPATFATEDEVARLQRYLSPQARADGVVAKLRLPGDGRTVLLAPLPNTVRFNNGGTVSVLRAPEDDRDADDVLVVVSLPGHGKNLLLDPLPDTILLEDEDVTVILRSPELQPEPDPPGPQAPSFTEPEHDLPGPTATALSEPEHDLPDPTATALSEPEHDLPDPAATALREKEHHLPASSAITLLEPEHDLPGPAVTAVPETEHHLPASTAITLLEPEHDLPGPAVTTVPETEHDLPGPTATALHQPEHDLPASTAITLLEPEHDLPGRLTPTAPLEPEHDLPRPTATALHEPERGPPGYSATPLPQPDLDLPGPFATALSDTALFGSTTTTTLAGQNPMTLSFAISAIAEPAPTLADRDRTFRPEPWSAHPSSRTNPASACWFAALEALYAERDGASSHVSAVAPNQVERLDAVLSNAAGSLRDRLGRPRGRRSSPASVPVAAKGLTEQRTRGSTPQPSQHLGPAGPVRVRGSDAKFSLCLVFGTKPLFARPALPANFRR